MESCVPDLTSRRSIRVASSFSLASTHCPIVYHATNCSMPDALFRCWRHNAGQDTVPGLLKVTYILEEEG